MVLGVTLCMNKVEPRSGIKDGDPHVKALVPVRIQGFLNDRGGMGLLCIDSDDSERIGETENVSFGETIGGDDYVQWVSLLTKMV